jgi:glutaconate CoA-transferase subunit A
MTNKLISLPEAADRVQSGDTIAIGGMTLYRRPVAFLAALIARPNRPTDLTILNFASSYEADLLVGAGMVGCLRTCYIGLEAFGLAPMFTATANAGELGIMEETEASLVAGVRAHLGGVSFIPAKGWIGTDLPALRPDVKIIDDPYRPGEQLVAFPAIPWDVAVIHAIKADAAGNALLNTNLGLDLELSLGAPEVIITSEEIVDHLDGPVHVPGAAVSAVVHVPGGAWPTSCYPDYSMDGVEIMRYADEATAAFDSYLDGLFARAPWAAALAPKPT